MKTFTAVIVAAAGAMLLVTASGPVSDFGLAAQAPSGSSAQGAKPPAKALTPDATDRLLAPIALYPDQLLAHVLLCATNPGRVAAMAEWLASNQSLKGAELQDAAVKSGFDQSFAALVVFPDVLDMMAGQPDWTRQLGEAFSGDRTAVFASIQRLRAKARAAGTLKSTPQQDVETRTTSAGQEVIVIEPANPQVVYVPQYNPQVVYVEDSSDAVVAGVIGFTAGIAIGAAIDNDYYYGPYGWYGGGAYMYNDAWDDWYDEREDMREDWQDNRQDVMEERGERREDVADERGDRAQTQSEQRTQRQENRPEAQAQREQRRTEAQGTARSGTAAQTTSGTQAARGYSREKPEATRERSGSRSDAFSGYSNGRSERAASSRGQSSRSRSGGGGGRRR